MTVSFCFVCFSPFVLPEYCGMCALQENCKYKKVVSVEKSKHQIHHTRTCLYNYLAPIRTVALHVRFLTKRYFLSNAVSGNMDVVITYTRRPYCQMCLTFMIFNVFRYHLGTGLYSFVPDNAFVKQFRILWSPERLRCSFGTFNSP